MRIYGLPEREICIDFRPVFRAYLEVIGANVGLLGSSVMAEPRIPTYTGADPPRSIYCGGGKSKRLKDSVENDIKRKFRTGRGGLGNPDELALRRLKSIRACNP